MIHIENFYNANFYCVVLVLMGFLNNLKFSNMKFRYINCIIFRYYFNIIFMISRIRQEVKKHNYFS